MDVFKYFNETVYIWISKREVYECMTDSAVCNITRIYSYVIQLYII